MTLYIGIDPGLQGAVARINERGGCADVRDTPTLMVKKSGKGHKNTYVAPEMLAALHALVSTVDITRGLVRAAIEYQASRPGQGAPATFSQGYGYGLWIMALAALCIPYEIISPVTWKKALRIPTGSDKAASIIMARQLFPLVELVTQRGREIDGRADALLIAEHLRRKRAKS